MLADGHIMSWGTKSNGILGLTKLPDLERDAIPHPDAWVPTQVLNITDAVDVVTATDHALALARDGTVYAWGNGENGQLGIGEMPIVNFTTHRPSALSYLPYPMRIPGLKDVTALAAGYGHSLAVLKDGTVRAWGSNRSGAIGDGTTIDRWTPVPVPGVRNAVAVGGGDGFSVALLADGTLMTWGGNGNGILARNPKLNPDPNAAPAIGPKGVRAIAVEMINVFALTDAGTVLSWGRPAYGSNGRSGSPLPTAIPGLSGVQSIAPGFAIRSDGTTLAWGFVPELTAGPEGVARTPVPLKVNGLRNP